MAAVSLFLVGLWFHTTPSGQNWLLRIHILTHTCSDTQTRTHTHSNGESKGILQKLTFKIDHQMEEVHILLKNTAFIDVILRLMYNPLQKHKSFAFHIWYKFLSFFPPSNQYLHSKNLSERLLQIKWSAIISNTCVETCVLSRWGVGSVAAQVALINMYFEGFADAFYRN